jgi:hypothetical protein
MSGFRPVNDTFQAHEKYEQGYYIGTVINNQDPLGFGRVQANVPNLYDSSQGEVPWIGPSKDSPFGYGTSTKGPFGFFGAPAVGSTIRIELQNGDEHKPVYLTQPTAPNANPAFKDPNTWGFQDPSGNQLLINMANGTWTFTHSSGDQVAYDAAGDRVTLIQGTDNLRVVKTMTIVVQGNAIIQSNTRVDVQAPLTTLNSITPVV